MTVSDVALARELAETAGAKLLALRGQGGLEGEALGRAGDALADEFLLNALRAARPDDGLLSEETLCDGSRLDHRRVWIIDPLDGTREYGEGRDDWAVHVGLAIDGVAAIGAVALPARHLVFTSDAGVVPPSSRAGLRMVVSRTRASPTATAVAKALGAETIPMGSAGAKAMAVVRGDADIYLHLGGQREWDSAAPVAVAAAHGLHCSRVDGGALRYNQADVSLPDLLICRRDLAAAVIDAVAKA